MLFVASPQDGAVAEGEAVQEQWPGTSVVALETAGHTVFADAPERFDKALEDFLSGLLNRERGSGRSEPSAERINVWRVLYEAGCLQPRGLRREARRRSMVRR